MGISCMHDPGGEATEYEAAPALPQPVGLVRSSWGSHPVFKGSYSFVAVGSSGEDIDELASPEGDDFQLLFAGEHTHRTQYSTVHGAMLSGRRAAESIISHHDRKVK